MLEFNKKYLLYTFTFISNIKNAWDTREESSLKNKHDQI